MIEFEYFLTVPVYNRVDIAVTVRRHNSGRVRQTAEKV